MDESLGGIHVDLGVKGLQQAKADVKDYVKTVEQAAQSVKQSSKTMQDAMDTGRGPYGGASTFREPKGFSQAANSFESQLAAAMTKGRPAVQSLMDMLQMTGAKRGGSGSGAEMLTQVDAALAKFDARSNTSSVAKEVGKATTQGIKDAPWKGVGTAMGMSLAGGASPLAAIANTMERGLFGAMGQLNAESATGMGVSGLAAAGATLAGAGIALSLGIGALKNHLEQFNQDHGPNTTRAEHNAPPGVDSKRMNEIIDVMTEISRYGQTGLGAYKLMPAVHGREDFAAASEIFSNEKRTTSEESQLSAMKATFLLAANNGTSAVEAATRVQAALSDPKQMQALLQESFGAKKPDGSWRMSAQDLLSFEAQKRTPGFEASMQRYLWRQIEEGVQTRTDSEGKPTRGGVEGAAQTAQNRMILTENDPKHWFTSNETLIKNAIADLNAKVQQWSYGSRVEGSGGLTRLQKMLSDGTTDKTPDTNPDYIPPQRFQFLPGDMLYQAIQSGMTQAYSNDTAKPNDYARRTADAAEAIRRKIDGNSASQGQMHVIGVTGP